VKNLVMKGLAARYPQSVRFTVVAWILTNTSFSCGTGASISRIRTTSGAPYLVCTAALMNEGPASHSAKGSDTDRQLPGTVAPFIAERRARERPCGAVEAGVAPSFSPVWPPDNLTARFSEPGRPNHCVIPRLQFKTVAEWSDPPGHAE
jgi:hypothetical protein